MKDPIEAMIWLMQRGDLGFIRDDTLYFVKAIDSGGMAVVQVGDSHKIMQLSDEEINTLSSIYYRRISELN